jgi:hypothetical protein
VRASRHVIIIRRQSHAVADVDASIRITRSRARDDENVVVVVVVVCRATYHSWVIQSSSSSSSSRRRRLSRERARVVPAVLDARRPRGWSRPHDVANGER